MKSFLCGTGPGPLHPSTLLHRKRLPICECLLLPELSEKVIVIPMPLPFWMFTGSVLPAIKIFRPFTALFSALQLPAPLSSASCAHPGLDPITFHPVVSASAVTTNSISVLSVLVTPYRPPAHRMSWMPLPLVWPSTPWSSTQEHFRSHCIFLVNRWMHEHLERSC